VQHADNPVDWWEWGPEALAVAKELDRPILLSVGYAACHWCHVAVPAWRVVEIRQIAWSGDLFGPSRFSE